MKTEAQTQAYKTNHFSMDLNGPQYYCWLGDGKSGHQRIPGMGQSKSLPLVHLRGRLLMVLFVDHGNIEQAERYQHDQESEKHR